MNLLMGNDAAVLEHLKDLMSTVRFIKYQNIHGQNNRNLDNSNIFSVYVNCLSIGFTY